MPQNSDLPITILGGYLGSGKTTLVNHLLKSANGKRLAILVNEFGDLPIDAHLIEAKDDDIISLSGGCVCCSFGSDLIGALREMARLDPPPDHIILEASGVALPGAILSSLSLLSGFKMDGVVVLADAETIQSRARDKYMSDTILRQLSDADLVILNKIDLIDKTSLKSLKTWIKNKAPQASTVTSERAQLPPGVVLQDFAPVSPSENGPPHLGGFSSRWIELNDPVEPNELAKKIIAETPNLVRAKGFVTDLNGIPNTIQIVGQRAEISRGANSTTRGLIVITHGSEDHSEAIEEG